ncbi:MAG: serine hydrolase domain-containing protein, partial [Planctomycetota bacterium]|nr:serine hydrolase domain-containing protein [Planctomycetota bacterium]
MKRDTNAILRALAAIGLGTMTGTAAAAECAPGEIEDCFGNCAPANWLGDGLCDDGTWSHDNNPIYLNCQGWNLDSGDCANDPFLPVSGMPVPSMAALDVAVLNIMHPDDVHAGAVGVMKDGVVVYQRFFGWKDQAKTQPLQPDTMMRIASVTKPHTAACIRALISDGTIDLNDNVFDVGQAGGGLLNIVPFNGLGDVQLANVTVDHCLRHRGGWNRNSTFGVGDLTYKEIEIKQDYNQDLPPSRAQTVSWILSQPLQHNPGTQYAYSNIGFLVLGLIVEEYAGMRPIGFLHERVLAPVGVLPAEVELGRTFPADRNPSEPWYDDQGATWPNVYATLDDLQNDPAGSMVPSPDGGWNMEARIGQGGLIATPRALLQFLDNYQISGTNIGVPRNKAAEGANWSWVHSGALSSGTNSIAHQWSDGYCFVAMFNRNKWNGTDYSVQARDAFKDLLDNGDIDVPSCPPNYVKDCNDNCVPAFWLGDGSC